MGVTYNYGAGPTYTKIGSQTLGSAAASVTFSSIPQGYTDLVIVVGSATFSANSTFYMQYNSDTGTNYSSTRLAGDGSAASSSRTTSANGAQIGAANGQSSSVMQTCIVQLQNYSNTTTYKTALARWSRSDAEVAATVSLWRNANAITSIQLYGGFANGTKNSNMQTGTTVTLYGVKAALRPKATGGDITTDGTYFIHTFQTSGVFQPNQDVTADYLVVAGGGGGGWGGGGGGGYRTSIGGSTLSLVSGTAYTVTVGAGGTGSFSGVAVANNGSNSVFSTITSTGGGGGGSYGAGIAAGNSGGSGGGGGSTNSGNSTAGGAGNAGSYSPVEGYAGGQGSPTHSGDGSSAGRAGAGGGSAAAGQSNTAGGVGGAGTLNSITGTSYYWAGGGGAGSQGCSAGNGGIGGGGGGARGFTDSGHGTAGGSSINPGTNGSLDVGGNGGSNTGGGAGGVGKDKGGNGGSGIVIVRYSA
jgi:hypothetical protein